MASSDGSTPNALFAKGSVCLSCKNDLRKEYMSDDVTAATFKDNI